MQQEKNTYVNKDRRKIVCIVCGLLAVIAAVTACIWLAADRTKASTGTGTAVIAPDYVKQMSEEVSGQVIRTLQEEILTDMISATLNQELTPARIREILALDESGGVLLSEDELQEKMRGIILELQLSGEGVLDQTQQDAIADEVHNALMEALVDLDVTVALTPQQRQQIEQTLRKELLEMLRTEIGSSTCQLSQSDLEKIRRYLNVDKLVQDAAASVTSGQAEKLRESISKIVEAKFSAKLPVKGKDYLTPEAIQKLLEKTLKEIQTKTISQVDQLLSQVTATVAEVDQLKKQIAGLSTEAKAMEDSHKADDASLQVSIRLINESIRKINANTDFLKAAIDISGKHLEKVSGDGSAITGIQTVNTAGLTIAEFVDILAGNDRVYSSAIEELNHTLERLHKYTDEQDNKLSDSIHTLEGALNAAGKDMEQSSRELEQKLNQRDDELSAALDDEIRKQTQRLDEEEKSREAGDKELQSGLDHINDKLGQETDGDEGLYESMTIFERLREIGRILSEKGVHGLREALKLLGGSATIAEGVEYVNENLTGAQADIRELKKNVWLADITLEPSGAGDGVSGYGYVENGASYTYQIPVVTQADGIELDAADTKIVVDFQEPGRLPSNVAFSTAGNDLLITFTAKPSRAVRITSIHVYTQR